MGQEKHNLKNDSQHGIAGKRKRHHVNTYIQNGRVLLSADKDTFLRSFEHLKTPDDTGPLTLEEIMLRTERSEWDEDITV